MLRRTATVSFKLSTLETFILGAVLAAIEGVNLSAAIPMSAHTRDAITVVIVVLGAFVQPITAAQFLAKIPPEIKAIVQALLAGILIVQQSWSLGTALTVALGVAIVIANTLGIGPSAIPPAAPPPA
jgi:hypothetical protein